MRDGYHISVTTISPVDFEGNQELVSENLNNIQNQYKLLPVNHHRNEFN